MEEIYEKIRILDENIRKNVFSFFSIKMQIRDDIKFKI